MKAVDSPHLVNIHMSMFNFMRAEHIQLKCSSVSVRTMSRTQLSFWVFHHFPLYLPQCYNVLGGHCDGSRPNSDIGIRAVPFTPIAYG